RRRYPPDARHVLDDCLLDPRRGRRDSDGKPHLVHQPNFMAWSEIMVKRRPQSNDPTDAPLLFPVHGVDDQFGYWNQRLGTAVDAVNVRGFDPKTDRARGSS